MRVHQLLLIVPCYRGGPLCASTIYLLQLISNYTNINRSSRWMTEVNNEINMSQRPTTCNIMYIVMECMLASDKWSECISRSRGGGGAIAVYYDVFTQKKWHNYPCSVTGQMIAVLVIMLSNLINIIIKSQNNTLSSDLISVSVACVLLLGSLLQNNNKLISCILHIKSHKSSFPSLHLVGSNPTPLHPPTLRLLLAAPVHY